MEGFLILLAVIIPLALLVLMIALFARMGHLSSELSLTRKQIAELMGKGLSTKPSTEQPPTSVPTPVSQAPPIVAPPLAPPPLPQPAPMPTAEEELRHRMQDAFAEAPPTASIVVEPPRPVPPPLRPPSTPAPPRPGFFERHPDLEKFIGENLINKIGIAVLVVGIGLLLRYAIGQGLISETGRTLIGVAAGGLLMFFGHRLRTSFRAFSSVLVAGGIAVFYSTIAIAFHQYHLLGQTAAFVVMVAITGFSVALAVGYDRKELAVISLLGGFAAPFLVSTGEGNYKVLFTYLLILDAGMLVLANYKKWHIINVLSFALTALVMSAWAADPYTDLEPRPSLIAFAFATSFFLVFFAMNLRYNLKHKQAFTALDHALLLANTGLYFGLGLHFLSDLPVRVTGLFTVLLGLFYLGFAIYFHKREGIPQHLKLLLIGLVLTFISLAAPVQLEGSHITLFWAAEAVLLLWFAQRTGLKLVERASVLVNALMLISLYMDWEQAYGRYHDVPLRPLLNKAWLAGIVATASLFITHRLLRRTDGDETMLFGLRRKHWGVFTLIASVAVLYGANMLEQRYQLARALHSSVVAQALLAYTLLHLLVVSWFSQKAARGYRLALGALLVLCGVVHITSNYAAARRALNISFANDLDLAFAPVHYLGMALMVIAVVRIALLARAVIGRPSSNWTFYLWSASFFIVVFASQELDLIMMQAQDTALTLSGSRRVGYPILWGVGSFLFMWYGMRTRMRALRIIALSLFGVTLLKLFLFDLRALSEGGRVAAFIFLGVLLLVISFMYQRIKGLFIDDGAIKLNDDAPSA
ncbi:MAG: DUF2339 domain-containing protein [Flavobacteriales bacterium]|nr:DUF2339 domain-containing protein [Flavobacteriales bacterium]